MAKLYRLRLRPFCRAQTSAYFDLVLGLNQISFYHTPNFQRCKFQASSDSGFSSDLQVPFQMEVAGDFEHASNIDFLSLSVSANFNCPSDIYGLEGEVSFALESSSDIDGSTLSTFV